MRGILRWGGVLILLIFGVLCLGVSVFALADLHGLSARLSIRAIETGRHFRIDQFRANWVLMYGTLLVCGVLVVGAAISVALGRVRIASMLGSFILTLAAAAHFSQTVWLGRVGGWLYDSLLIDVALLTLALILLTPLALRGSDE